MKLISIVLVMAAGPIAMTGRQGIPATMKIRAMPVQGGIQASMTRGKQVYLEQCLACHQADGSGVPNMNPPLIKSKYVQGDKAALVRIVLNGMKGTKIGDVDYSGVMVPHPDLTDAEIADVLTFARNSFGNKASAVTAAQVKAVRATNKPPVD